MVAARPPYFLSLARLSVSGLAFPSSCMTSSSSVSLDTVITAVRRTEGKTVLVRGTTSDNGTVKRVLVNGKEARSVSGNFAEWEIELNKIANGEVTLQAHAEDAAGNVEKRRHVMVVR